MMYDEKPLNSITAGELMDMPLQPSREVVDGFLPTGTYILAGTPKIGKSFLMTQLCWCVSEGERFLEYDTKQATVLYLALEDTDFRLQQRMGKMFGVDWPGKDMHLVFEEKRQGWSLVRALQKFVSDHPETRLIVIDTLVRARTHDNSIYSYATDYQDVLPFKEFADKCNLSLILVHHTRKNTESANPFDQISGTNGLMGAADGAFILRRGKDHVFLDFVGRDLPERRYALQFAESKCLWELIDSDAEVFEEPPEPLLDWIDALVLDFWNGTATRLLHDLKEFAPDTLDWQPNQLTKRLNVLTVRLAKEKGIRYTCSRKSDSRMLHFERIGAELPV